MTFQIHFKIWQPHCVLEIESALVDMGFTYIRPNLSYGPVLSMYINTLYINPALLIYHGKRGEPHKGVPMLEWSDSIEAELKLVPREVWVMYLEGYANVIPSP